MNIKNLNIKKVNAAKKAGADCFVVHFKSDLKNSPHKKWAIKQSIESKKTAVINNEKGISIYVYVNAGQDSNAHEDSRKKGHELLKILENAGVSDVNFHNSTSVHSHAAMVLEGLMLSFYKFDKYLSNKSTPKLRTVNVVDSQMSTRDLSILKNTVYAVHTARTLVNEPLSFLTATQLSSEFRKYTKGTKVNVKVLNKAQITKLKMGGILAVNRGSEDPPTFNILEYKHPKAKNSSPIVLVGKGIVYDTGGLSLKGTKASMDRMKSDMSGAAVAFGILLAAALNNLPLHIILLVAATDNRPGKNAYAPGDVIKMYDGTTVEVLNTDAEGRLILADSLAYAKKYKPELVMDFATLTGSASATLGSAGIVCMGTADDNTKEKLNESGYYQYERLVELPLWNEYGDMMKSQIADLKNIGGPRGGAISAGKFLEHFTDYDWMHFDIAGVSYTISEMSYNGTGGTGIGIRMGFDFLSNYTQN